jgi:predicted RNase H-like nuclease
MTAVAGIDGYPSGWVRARLVGDVIEWATAPVDAIGDLLDRETVTGIDMPIGLSEDGFRTCDAQARALLPGAGSRVFTTPPRAVLEVGLTVPNAEVQRLCRELTGSGVSRQALGLATRILALDDHLARRPGLDVIEVHPELSFAALAGAVLPSKKSAAGVGARIAALQSWRPGIAHDLARAPSDVPVDDALDALAALWSAVHWRDGQARTVPAGARDRPFIAI